MNKILMPTFPNNLTPWTDDCSKKAVVLMSGGVDSSAAALILQRKGYSVAGLTMKISSSTDNSACESAAAVCRTLLIPHFSVDISDEFKTFVSEPFCRAYKLGMTPNPCADCNEHVKFGLLWDIAELKFGSSFYVATGHYAQIVRVEGKAYISRSANTRKDQSYFLSGISSDRIQRILFPLGSYTSKDGIRALVRSAGLLVSERPESMEICFAGENDYRSVLSIPAEPGPITDTSGKIIGTHKGITGYTLGQRKGLGISSRNPLFVVAIKPYENTIIVAPKEAAFSNTVAAQNVNMLAPQYVTEGAHLFGKIRSQGEPAPCSILSCGNSHIYVRFKIPVFAPAPGQRLVLYTSDGIVAAGGIITNT